MKTIKELAQEAIDVQDACNISGVANTFVRVLHDLRQLPEYTGNDWLHAHPVTRAWVDKLASLAGVQGTSNSSSALNATDAHAECDKLAGRV